MVTASRVRLSYLDEANIALETSKDLFQQRGERYQLQLLEHIVFYFKDVPTHSA